MCFSVTAPLCALQEMGVEEAHPERSYNRRGVQEGEGELQVGNVGKAMPSPTPGHEAHPTDHAEGNPHQEPEENPFMQVEEFGRQPLEQSRLPQLQEQASAKHLCTQKAQEHCENQGMIVKQCKPTEDHAWTKGTHGGDEGGEHHESETAIEEEPRGACQDGEQVPHAIPPGLQVR